MCSVLVAAGDVPSASMSGGAPSVTPHTGRGAAFHHRPGAPAWTTPLEDRQLPGDVAFVAERRYTTPVTCRLDGQAHDVTDESVATGHHTGEYQALCGYVVLPTPMVAPAGRRCARCTAMSGAAQPTTDPVRRARHRPPGWRWRRLRLGWVAEAWARCRLSGRIGR